MYVEECMEGYEKKKVVSEVKRQPACIKRISVMFAGLVLVCVMTGCTMLSDERVKLRDLDFTVLSEEKIPAELLTIIKEKGAEPFKLTYTDNEYLYIAIGYGEQNTGGYSIAVNELYLTDNAIYVNTSLLGPDANAVTATALSYPFIVLKTEKLDQTVFFE